MESVNPDQEQRETLVLPEVSPEGVERVIEKAVNMINEIKGLNHEMYGDIQGPLVSGSQIERRNMLQEGVNLIVEILDEIMPKGKGYWAKRIVEEGDSIQSEKLATARMRGQLLEDIFDGKPEIVDQDTPAPPPFPKDSIFFN
ncbi:MAG: hypothetical protein A3B14_02505 [Candidatus Zambryskibacteria bacterium RIFCSPLOWO2_01_FULL_45_21]|uniref:Uncharacterized protein n=1 Tax=Candidatus Zambryskibacteria bacterium RIFCSPLOWO2_01_FULL_45_21 TaxID=1802761 RepID=A0A1G2U1A1_9BACT|nr:MAG: hypothetical protein A3B14_02505 [Candidatus Zambryskibacteria bacterium RIFCSPLOWO2_01_FULL_45_21]